MLALIGICWNIFHSNVFAIVRFDADRIGYTCYKLFSLIQFAKVSFGQARWSSAIIK